MLVSTHYMYFSGSGTWRKWIMAFFFNISHKAMDMEGIYGKTAKETEWVTYKGLCP